jgi:eukaryotic-like serine/threonine-protein kinase
VQVRVFMGFGAWLVGVGAATAGSLVAVSLLGQGIAPSTSQQLSSDAVNRALAVEATEASVSASGSPSPTPSKPRPRKTPPTSPPPSQPQAQPQVNPVTTRPSPTHSPQPTSNAASTPVSTVLTSQGGTVVADCPSGEAYLVSWSPTQGYEVGTVTRGPAVTAQVTFESDANTVTMVVSCTGGTPAATTTVSPIAGGTHTDE